MQIVRNKKNGGIQARVGLKFYQEIEKIKDLRLRNGNSRERVSTEKITNLLIRHNFWQDLINDIIEATDEEVNKLGI